MRLPVLKPLIALVILSGLGLSGCIERTEAVKVTVVRDGKVETASSQP